jgi:hypothetical protein
MEVELLETRFRQAVIDFWTARSKNREEQQERGSLDQGNRAEVTGGTQLGALELLIKDILVDAGLDQLDVRTRTKLEIPGFFRSEKQWDLLVITRAGEANRLVLAVELKSMAGSTGKNLNNRTEEAIGNAVDLWTAFRENRFGDDVPRPFVGFLALVENLDEVNIPVKSSEPYFEVDPIFRGKTYAERWNILCRRLVTENLYTASCCELVDRAGNHRSLDQQTSFQAFAAAIEGHAIMFRTRVAGSDTAQTAIRERVIRRFHGSVALDPIRMVRDASEIVDAVVQHLTGQPGSHVEVTVEIQADLIDGVSDDVVRTVTENARTLKFKSYGFEEE